MTLLLTGRLSHKCSTKLVTLLLSGRLSHKCSTKLVTLLLMHRHKLRLLSSGKGPVMLALNKKNHLSPSCQLPLISMATQEGQEYGEEVEGGKCRW